MRMATPVLVIDDEEADIIAKVLKAYCIGREQVFDPTPVDNYADAIGHLKTGRFAAAIVDMDFPTEDGLHRDGGLRLLREVSVRELPTRTLVLTGHGSMTNMAAAAKFEPAAYLEKNADVFALLPDLLQAIISQDRATRSLAPTSPEATVSGADDVLRARKRIGEVLDELHRTCMKGPAADTASARALLITAAEQLRNASFALGMILDGKP